MIYPDKFTPLDQSMLGKSIHLIREPGVQITVSRLREETARIFTDVGEFVLAMDVLFALGKIELNESGEVVTYVK